MDCKKHSNFLIIFFNIHAVFIGMYWKIYIQTSRISIFIIINFVIFFKFFKNFFKVLCLSKYSEENKINLGFNEKNSSILEHSRVSIFSLYILITYLLSPEMLDNFLMHLLLITFSSALYLVISCLTLNNKILILE
jgi:hypothetical protein